MGKLSIKKYFTVKKPPTLDWFTAKILHKQKTTLKTFCLNLLLTLIISTWVIPALIAYSQTPSNQVLRVVVTSNQDGEIQPDNALTLREAISLIDGKLPLENLSTIERNNISSVGGNRSRIDFNLPSGNTTIELNSPLPALAVPLVIDGTTQPGYRQKNGENMTTIPQPVVVIKPAAGVEVFRGFTVVADDVIIRALSIYGFSSRQLGATANIPPADIFIANANDAATFGNKGKARNPNRNAPQNVIIDSNWLGLDNEQIKNTSKIDRKENRLPNTSAFGVYVFNSLGTTIRNNLIANHDGSGIITSSKAINLTIADNILLANGFGGMPDAIRLEGNIAKTKVISNFITNNAGSAIYLFKPAGSIEIRENKITNNGRQFEQAAIYLMGSDHQITNNQISDQPGPGIVVAAYPDSDRNVILGNEFANLKGLSIDLVTQMNTDFHAYLLGDGPNPKMRSFQRRRQTGNFGIDAPNFVSKEFFLDPKNGKVTLQGTAKSGANVEIYRVDEDSNRRGPLSKVIADTVTDKDGKFSVTIPNLKAGERVSAIANNSESGTSEPAVNAVIKQLP